MGVSSISTVPSSSCLGVGILWSEEWHCCFMPVCGGVISETLGRGAAGASPLSAMAHNWAVANIPRSMASDTLPVRSCRGYRNVPQASGRQAHMATQRPPQRLGNPTSPLPLSGAPVLAHYLCEPIGGHRLWLYGVPCLVVWPQWPGLHSGKPELLCLSPALCGGDPRWPCL